MKAADGEHRTATRRLVGDPWRAFVFPNRIRELRRERGFLKLLDLNAALAEIPYARLSKLERGEVFARAGELAALGRVLGVHPAELLIDMDAPGFDIARWAEPFHDPGEVDTDEDLFAIKLAAAMRAERASHRALTIVDVERDFGIAPVILSRIENAFKPLSRWNAATVRAMCRLFGVGDEAELRALVERRFQAGELDASLDGLDGPDARLRKSRARIAALREELAAAPVEVAPASLATAVVRLLPVLGAPVENGLIAPISVPGANVEAPRHAGPRAFALRVGHALLGPGLPASAVVVADPDVRPSPGGLALLREGDCWRLLAIDSKDRDTADLAAVLSVVFP